MDIERSLELVQHHIHIGHYDGAIDTLKQVLGLEPDLAEAHALLALCLLEKRRVYAAEQEAKTALAIEPSLELSHFALANIYIAQRKFTQAKESIQHLLEMDPHNVQYYLLKARLMDLIQKKAEILPLLEKALELEPGSAEVLSELSDYYIDTFDLDLAESYAHQSLQSEPENVNGLVSMGRVLLFRGATEEAREHAVWALRQSPTNGAALALMAGIKARKSPILGLWWRYHVWSSRMGMTRSVLVLLFAYICYRVLTMGFADLDMEQAAGTLQLVWLGFVLYTFIGPGLFERSLEKELGDIKLNENF